MWYKPSKSGGSHLLHQISLLNLLPLVFELYFNSLPTIFLHYNDYGLNLIVFDYAVT